jgi:hypothetical protein
MPYKTTAEKEREKWMTLPEAVIHIRSADGCDEEEARRQLIAALADLDAHRLAPLGPRRWAQEDGVQMSGLAPVGPVWLEAQINWETGTVRDDWDAANYGKWRLLLISRWRVYHQWPSREANTDSRGGPSESPVSLVRNAGGRPTVREQVVDALLKMRSEGVDLNLKHTRLAELAAKHSGKSLGDPGWNERTIVAHVSSWLRDNR